MSQVLDLMAMKKWQPYPEKSLRLQGKLKVLNGQTNHSNNRYKKTTEGSK